ncbi:MAG: PhnD/SsuA/transferrin family substrate-binding protein [Bacilli bacterium]|jgi:ABC-type phosphate/phosphonate transport system substrate-binding protein|nr:PhnD/SsuA/transferrin family substrate-binding protein [Bacilli bacterium]
MKKHLVKTLIVGSIILAGSLASCSSGTGNAIDATVTPLASNAYKYLGQQSSTEVMYYSGIMFCLRDEARSYIGKKALDANGDGTVTLAELHDAGAVWGHMSSTSSSGTVYPNYYLYNNGYTLGFKTQSEYDALSAEDKAKAVIGVDQGTYPDSIDSLFTGKLDVVCGFMDTRYGSAYVQADSKYKGNDNLFLNTYTVAITDPIMNDTVSIRADLSEEKQEAIKTAFKTVVKQGDKSTEGTGAYLLYQIYSHTGYVDAADSDYDKARQMYEWTRDHSGKSVSRAIATPVTAPKNVEDNTISIELVPSNDPTTLATRAKALEPLLDAAVGNKFSFSLTVGTAEGGYELVTQALVSETIDAAFLPAASYAQATELNPGKVEVLLSASRAGYKVQADDFPGFDDAAKALQIKAMNGQIDADGNPIA